MNYVKHGILFFGAPCSPPDRIVADMQRIWPYFGCSPRTQQRIDEAVKRNRTCLQHLTSCYQPPPLEVPPSKTPSEGAFKVPGTICDELSPRGHSIPPLFIDNNYSSDKQSNSTNTNTYTESETSPERPFNRYLLPQSQLSRHPSAQINVTQTGPNTPNFQTYSNPYPWQQEIANRNFSASKQNANNQPKLESVEVQLNAQRESFVMQAIRQTYVNSTGKPDDGNPELGAVPSWPQIPDVHKSGKRNSTFLGRASSASVQSQYENSTERPKTADVLIGHTNPLRWSPNQDKVAQRPSLAISANKVQFKNLAEDKPSFSASEGVESVAIEQMTSLLNELSAAKKASSKSGSAKKPSDTNTRNTNINSMPDSMPVSGPSSVAGGHSQMSEFSDFGHDLQTILKSKSKTNTAKHMLPYDSDAEAFEAKISCSGKVDMEVWVDMPDLATEDSELSDFYRFIKKTLKELPHTEIKLPSNDDSTSFDLMPIHTLAPDNRQIIDPMIAIVTTQEDSIKSPPAQSLSVSMSMSQSTVNNTDVEPKVMRVKAQMGEVQQPAQRTDNKKFDSRPVTPEQSDSISVDITESMLIRAAVLDGEVSPVVEKGKEQVVSKDSDKADTKIEAADTDAADEYKQDSFISDATQDLQDEAKNEPKDPAQPGSLDNLNLENVDLLLASLDLSMNIHPSDPEPEQPQEEKLDSQRSASKEDTKTASGGEDVECGDNIVVKTEPELEVSDSHGSVQQQPAAADKQQEESKSIVVDSALSDSGDSELKKLMMELDGDNSVSFDF